MTDILTFRSRTSAGVTNNIDDGSAQFRFANKPDCART